MNMMGDPALAGMLPFDTMGLYEPPKPRYIFKMPRVVPDQKEKFETDDLFRKLSRDAEVSFFLKKHYEFNQKKLKWLRMRGHEPKSPWMNHGWNSHSVFAVLILSSSSKWNKPELSANVRTFYANWAWKYANADGFSLTRHRPIINSSSVAKKCVWYSAEPKCVCVLWNLSEVRHIGRVISHEKHFYRI